jgi:exonuclease III
MLLNVHASREDKIDDVKDNFYEELKSVFDKFHKYHLKMLLGDLNIKVDREDIFKLTIGNENLHGISNDNGIRVVNFATSKVSVTSTMFSHHNIQSQYVDNIMIDRRRHSFRCT